MTKIESSNKGKEKGKNKVRTAEQTPSVEVINQAMTLTVRAAQQDSFVNEMDTLGSTAELEDDKRLQAQNKRLK